MARTLSLPKTTDEVNLRQRGATLTGYALMTALIVVVSLGSMKALEDNGEEFLVGTGQSIGEPRQAAEEARVNQITYNPNNSIGPGYSPADKAAKEAADKKAAEEAAAAAAQAAADAAAAAAAAEQALDDEADANAVLTGNQPFFTPNVPRSDDPSRFEHRIRSASRSNPNTGEIELKAGAAGTYEILLTGVTARDGLDNSFFVSINGGPLIPFHIKIAARDNRTVQRYDSANTRNLTPLTFTTDQRGETVSIVVYEREDGTAMGGVALRPIN